MSEFTLLGFVEHLAVMAAEVVIAEHHALEHAAKVVEKEAKDSIGHYQSQSGPFVAWAELADSTKADRARKGYAEDEPELRDGTLRDSIEHNVGGRDAHIGSNNPIMVFQELGTAKMPPRSILGGAAARKEKEVVEIIGETMVAALIGEKVHMGALSII